MILALEAESFLGYGCMYFHKRVYNCLVSYKFHTILGYAKDK